MTLRAETGLPAPEKGTQAAAHGRTEVPLADRVRTGALWTAASNLLLRVSNILVVAVVARIVAPRELGVFALAVALQVLLADMAALGVASAIARSDVDADRIAPTVASIAIGAGLVLALLMAAFANPLAGMLGASQAVGAIRILSLCLALNGVFAVPAAQLQRGFRQDVLFRASVISFFPGSAVLLLLASVGDGTVAFAWSRVVGQLVAGAIMVRGVGRNYRPGLDRGYVRPLLRFGFPLAMANVLSQILLNVDYVFVSRLMSTTDVGLYMLAFTVCTWPTALLGPVLNSMVLPAFSTVRRDAGDVSRALSYAVGTVGLIAFPIAALTCALATPLITTLYGHRWAAAGPALSVLSLYAMFFVLGLLFANIIISTGRTVILFVVQVAAILGLLPALAAGVRLAGLVGVATAHLVVVSVMTLPVYLVAIRRSTGVATGPVVRALARPLCGAVAAAVVARLVSMSLRLDVLELVAGGAAGAIVYVVITAPLLRRLLPAGAARRWTRGGAGLRVPGGGE